MTADYYTFHCAMQGKRVFHNGKKVDRAELFSMITQGKTSIADVQMQVKGWKIFDVPGWQNGKIVNKKLVGIT